MRTFMVVGLAPSIEVFLSFGEVTVGGGSVEDFDFKGTVEAFAFALSLRVIGTSMDDVNAQAQEPDAEGGQGYGRIRVAPGRSVVAEDAVWQAVTVEDAL